MELSAWRVTALFSTICSFYTSFAQVAEIGFNPQNYTVRESDRSLEVTVIVLDGYIPAGQNATAVLNTQRGSAVGGEDYEVIRNQVLLFDNDTSVVDVVVNVFEDNVEEDDEEFFLVLSLEEPPSRSRVVKRSSLRIETKFASIYINDTSGEVNHALAIGLGIGFGVGIPLTLVVAAVILVKAITGKFCGSSKKDKTDGEQPGGQLSSRESQEGSITKSQEVEGSGKEVETNLNKEDSTELHKTPATCTA